MIDLPDLALSVRQPWVHCILELGKPVENRDWSTKLRGPVCLHAAKGMTKDEWYDCLDVAREAAARFPETYKGKIFPKFDDLPRGGIVGVVDIVDVVTASDSPWFFGKYGFVLSNPRPVAFIAVKGQLGFFEWRRNLVDFVAAPTPSQGELL